MKLFRIELTDWRGFRGGPWTVRFDDAITLIHGDNEAGKSTLFEAVRWALFERSKKTSKDTPKIVPIDRPGAEPVVTLSFEHDGESWEIEKRFGRKGTALLSRQLAEGELEEVARHDEATEIVASRLGAILSKRGESSPANWGALRWLFMPQGAAARQLPDAKSEAVNSLGLEGSAGTSEAFDHIAARVVSSFDRHFTPTGIPKAGSELKTIDETIIELEKAVDRLRSELAEADELRARHDSLSDQLPGVEADLELARADWKSVQAETTDFGALEEGLKTAEERRRRLEQEVQALVVRVTLREQLEGRLKTANTRLENARKRDAEDRFLFERATEALEIARREHGAARSAARDARDALEAARRIHDGQRTAAELARLDERLTRARTLDAEIQIASAAAGVTAPTEASVTHAEALTVEVARHEAALTAVQLHLKIDDPELEVFVDGKRVTEVNAAADERVEVRRRGEDRGVIIESDPERAARQRLEADHSREELQRILGSFGVSTTAQLRDLVREAESRDRNLAEKRAARQGVDPRDTQTIEAERAHLAAAAAAAGSENDETAPQVRVDLGDLEQKAKSCADNLERLEARYEKLEVERERSRGISAASSQDLVLAHESYEQARQEREGHAGEFGSLEVIRRLAESKQCDLDEDQKRAADFASDLTTRRERVQVRRETAQRRHDGLISLLAKTRSEKSQLAEELDRRSLRGAWSELGDYERRLESERRRRERLQAMAEGARQLREAIEAVRSEVVAEIVAPVRDGFQEYLSFVTQGRYQGALLDQNLLPQDLSTRGSFALGFDQGSEGLRELANALLRLAVAVDLTRRGPQVLILDDPCAQVSRDRSMRFGELINRLVRERPLQVIILTHRPTELLGLTGSTLDLDALRRAGPSPTIAADESSQVEESH